MHGLKGHIQLSGLVTHDTTKEGATAKKSAMERPLSLATQLNKPKRSGLNGGYGGFGCRGGRWDWEVKMRRLEQITMGCINMK